MEKLANSIDKVVIDMTVRNMLNENNKHFYIGKLSIEQVENLLMDDYATDIFWSAFAIASASYLKSNQEYHVHSYSAGCPECGCQSYISGCACPNCDYVE